MTTPVDNPTILALREQRFNDAVALKKPDRVPLMPLALEYFHTRMAGVSDKVAGYDAKVNFDCLRDAFLGNYHTETDPAAVIRGECSGSSELGGNHCGALHKRLVLPPAEETRLISAANEKATQRLQSLKEQVAGEAETARQGLRAQTEALARQVAGKVLGREL